MIQVGDYNWRVLKENDGTEVYQLIIHSQPDSGDIDILLYYNPIENIFSIRNTSSQYNGGDIFFMKIDFEQTSMLIKSLIDGNGGRLMPIYHKDTVKIK